VSAPECPFCGSAAVERVGQWGGQIITAQWRCRTCNTYFEAVRDDFDEPAPADARDDRHRR
jgi:ribosomal protein L37AE/L43A